MTCAFCGHTNEPDVRFCARCGAQIQPSQPAQNQEPQQYPDYQQTPQYQESPQYRQQPEYQQTPQYPETPQYQEAPQYPQYQEAPQYQAPSQYQQYQLPQQHAGQPRDPYYQQTADTTNTASHARTRSGTQQGKKGLTLKKILLFGVPLVIIIIAAIIVIPMLIGPGGSTVNDYIELFSDKGEVIVSGNNNPKFTIDGVYANSEENLEGNKMVLMTDYSSRTGGTLWFVTPSAATKIADDIMDYRFSDSGNGIAYFTNYDNNESLATLYLYNTSSKKATMVTDYAYYNGNNMEGVAVSPDGKSVTYIGDVDERRGDFTGYISIDGKIATEIGERMAAVAISNSGRHIYYLKVESNGNASFHAKSGQNDNKIIPDIGYGLSILLNKEYSQVLFAYEGRSYISRNATDRERINGASISSLVTPKWAQEKSYETHYYYAGVRLNLTTRVHGISSFSDFVARTSDGLVYYNSRLEPNKISGSTSFRSAQLSSDGKSLYFTTDTKRLNVVDPTMLEADRMEIARNVESFAASADGKNVYYVNNERELFYYSSGTDTPRRIADEVDSHFIAITGGRLFFLVDYRNGSGDLYFSNNGGARTRVPGATEVSDVYTTPANAFYMTSDGELFRSNGNERFIMFHDDFR